jgi:hypothetical protein
MGDLPSSSTMNSPKRIFSAGMDVHLAKRGAGGDCPRLQRYELQDGFDDKIGCGASAHS